MSSRGGLTLVDDVELGAEVSDGSRVPSSASASEPPPRVPDADLGAGPRVVRADSLLGSALRTLLREHRARGGDADAVVAALASGGADASPTPPRSPRSDPASASPSSSLARLLSPGATGDGRGTLGVASHRAVDRANPANDASDGTRTPDRAVRGGDLADLERLLEINRELRRVEVETRRRDAANHSSETPADGIRTRDAPEPGPGPGSPGFDLRAAARWLEHTVPAAAVVVAAFAARHAVGIVAFAWATAFLLRADALLRAQVALRAERSPRHVAWCVVMVATALAALAFAFPDDGFWTRLVFAAPASGPRTTGPVSFVRVLWETAMADTVARYVTVGAKAALIFATDAWAARAARTARRGDAKVSSDEDGSLRSGERRRRRERERERDRDAEHATSGAVSVSSATSSAAASLMETLGVTTTARGAAHHRDNHRDNHRDRDRALLLPPPPRSSASASRAAHRRTTARLSLLEHVSLAYRCVLPVPAWFAFFRDDDAGGRLVAAAATGAYLAVKIRGGVDRGARVIGAWRALRDAEARHGVPADPAEAAERGGECSICQERFRDPTRLRCGHVFCEECVGEWFERERTCPLCRAVIKTAAVATHGDGGTVMFAHVF